MSRFRQFVQDITPPLALRLASRMRAGRRPTADDVLFDGHDTLFKSAARKSSAYGEYGVGDSTVWMATHTSLPIVSVDTSEEWIVFVRERLPDDGSAHLTHIDLGPLGAWGRPLTYQARNAFIDYAEAPFSTAIRPDLILVDGRLRVACFLTALLRANSGATVIFDDYMRRPHYHVVEEIVLRDEDDGRQARFTVPRDRDMSAIRELRDAFLYVLD